MSLTRHLALLRQRRTQPGQQDISAQLPQMLFDLLGKQPGWTDDVLARIDAADHKYGGAMCTHDGRDSLVDLYQELLDAVTYLVKGTIEQDARIGYVEQDLLHALAALTTAVQACLLVPKEATTH
jgi:hypothetical protein